MNKDIHCLKKWDEVIIFNNEIFYTPPVRIRKPDRSYSNILLKLEVFEVLELFEVLK